MKKTREIIDTAALRKLASAYDVDPRTLDKTLRGESVRGAAGRRARIALIDAGLLRQDPGEVEP